MFGRGLKSVAKLEAAKPTSSDAMVDVAEAWFVLSSKEELLLHKRRYKGRARYWFDEAMKSAGGSPRPRLRSDSEK